MTIIKTKGFPLNIFQNTKDHASQSASASSASVSDHHNSMIRTPNVFLVAPLSEYEQESLSPYIVFPLFPFLPVTLDICLCLSSVPIPNPASNLQESTLSIGCKVDDHARSYPHITQLSRDVLYEVGRVCDWQGQDKSRKQDQAIQKLRVAAREEASSNRIFYHDLRNIGIKMCF